MKKQSEKRQNLNHITGNWTVAEIAITFKPVLSNCKEIKSSHDAYEIIKQLWDNEKFSIQEQFAALFLNQSNKVIGWKVLSTGTMTKCLVDIKLLASLALHCMATHVMIAHNHPSGNLKASENDKILTGTVKAALKLIDVQLLDHLIITDSGYLSFADEGIA